MEKQTRWEAVQDRQVAASFDSLELAGEFRGGGTAQANGLGNRPVVPDQKEGQQAGWTHLDWGRMPR